MVLNNNYYKMTKKDITNKVIGAGIGLALGALPIVSDAQTIKEQQSLQRGVNAPTYAGETPTHILYHFDFNKDLERAIKTSEKPEVYVDKSHRKDSYLVLDSDTSGYTLYYNKNNFDESGKGRDIILTVRELGKVGVCPKGKLGSNESSLPSFKITPTLSFIGKSEEPSKEPSNQPVSNYNQTIINKDSHDIYNYIYGDTSKEKQRSLSTLELRAIIDANKVVNPLMSPFFNFSLNPQLVYNNPSGLSVGFGPYFTRGFGKNRDLNITNIENEVLLDQHNQLFSGTVGMRKENIEKCFPTEWGAILSIGKNNKVRGDFGYGLINESESTSGISESGFDYIRQGGEIIQKKDYGPIYVEKGKTSENIKHTQHASIYFSPFKNGKVGLKGKVKHIGKPGSEDGFFHYEVGLSGTIGGGKHRK